MQIRRAAVLQGAALTAISTDWPTALSVPESARIIRESCDERFLSAVSAAGTFLYRGEPAIDAAAVLEPAPDLLQAGTYGSTAALRFFEQLERSLAKTGSVARPSTGHIGIADRALAARWGTPVSIWPVGPLHYVWPRGRDVFWPDKADGAGYAIDDALVDALRLRREVLFASADGRSAFVAVPATRDADLRRRLSLTRAPAARSQ